MHATTSTANAAETSFVKSASLTNRYVVTVGDTPREVRARTIAMIADVLGFEQEMEGEVADLATLNLERLAVGSRVEGSGVVVDGGVRVRTGHLVVSEDGVKPGVLGSRHRTGRHVGKLVLEDHDRAVAATA